MPNNLCLTSPTSLYYTAQWKLISALISSKPINWLVANISSIPIIEPIIEPIIGATLLSPTTTGNPLLEIVDPQIVKGCIVPQFPILQQC